MKLKFLIAIFVLISFGCGETEFFGESKKSSSEDQHAAAVTHEKLNANGGLLYATQGALPKCDSSENSDTKNLLVYVLENETFYYCDASSTWTEIDLKGKDGKDGTSGEKGQDGQDGSNGVSDYSISQPLALYKKYRQSVFRVSLNCQCADPIKNTCNSSANISVHTITVTGTAFACADDFACTNKHVVQCPSCCTSASVNSLKLQMLPDNVDSLAPSDNPVSPFVEISTAEFDSKVTTAGGVDLAKISIDSYPTKVKVMELTDKAFDPKDKVLSPVLSMSFPLGFSELYVDLGKVNASSLEKCNTGSYTDICSLDFSTSNDTDKGSSGSPLLDVQSGKVIGVVTAGTLDENANFTWALDAVKLKDF